MSLKAKAPLRRKGAIELEIGVPENVGHASRVGDRVDYQVIQFDGQNWKPAPLNVPERISIPLDLDHSKPFDPDVRILESRRRAKKLRRRRLVRVTSTLGLINVRIAPSSITQFSNNDLKRSCLLSELAYHSPQVFAQVPYVGILLSDMSKGFPINIGGAEATDPQATLWLFKKTADLFVSFRGQYDGDKVYYSLGTAPNSVASSSKNVHEIFVTDLMNMEPYIRWWIENSVNSIKRIIVTGHGLGGSLATIAAPLFAESFPDLSVSCITFGASRVGGSDFNDWFRDRVSDHVRVIDSSDPIPYLPLGRADLGHPSDALCITRSGYVETWGAGVQPSAQVLEGIERIDFDEWRWQHSAQKYRKRVDAAISRGKSGQTGKEYVITPPKPSRRGA